MVPLEQTKLARVLTGCLFVDDGTHHTESAGTQAAKEGSTKAPG
jgi:hypothetical protein